MTHLAAKNSQVVRCCQVFLPGKRYCLNLGVQIRGELEGLEDLEALLAACNDVHVPVFQVFDLVNVGSAPDFVDFDFLLIDFHSLADQHHAKGLVFLQAVMHHLAVALLEDMQVYGHVREQHGMQGEDGQFVHIE